jgi:succinyl-CoA synthetase beta subunit
MQLHEYQSKALFQQGGMFTPKGLILSSLSEADSVLDQLTLPVVVKAQVHAGGRGKAGGIKLAKTREEAIAAIKAILGMTLKTKQTGEKGLLVRRVYVEQASSFRTELYLSILNDRTTRNPVLIVSKAGGMDIEEVAEKTPDAILTLQLNINRGISDHICRRVHYFWSDGSFAPKETAVLLKALWQIYLANDASMVEINPVAVTMDNRLMALDAKMTLDDNARFRHKDWDALDLEDEVDPFEVEAAKFDLNYVKLWMSVAEPRRRMSRRRFVF